MIKGGQVVSKLLGAKPKEYSSLLEGAEQAEQTLQSKSLEILRGDTGVDEVKIKRKVFPTFDSPDHKLNWI